MSSLNYLRKRGASPTLEEDELLAERVKSYPCFYDKTCKEHQKRTQKTNNSIVADNTF